LPAFRKLVGERAEGKATCFLVTARIHHRRVPRASTSAPRRWFHRDARSAATDIRVAGKARSPSK
jgi:hypothetical protein